MKQSNYMLFTLGLFSQLYISVIGSMAISELYMFCVAPFVFLADLRILQRDGFMPFLKLVFLAMVGCVMSSCVNSTPFPMAIRGFASIYSLFAVTVVFHRYLACNMNGLRWLILGTALSAVISIFGFQSAVEIATGRMVGGGVEDTELYYVRHFGGLLTVWYRGWYMNCPTAIAAVLMLVPIAQLLIFTSTGRSALGSTMVSIIMLCYVNRKVSRMRKLGRNILMGGFFVVVLAFGLVQAYKYAAMAGYLSEQSQHKYEEQTKNGGGLLEILMRGRADFFVGGMACLNRPFVGYGPWPVDDGHYWESFILKYGDSQDYEKFRYMQAYGQSLGLNQRLIPSHSFIVGFWLWYGILALPLWPYVIKKVLEYLHRYMDAIPQWFAYLACGAPGVLWNVLFSPFASRIAFSMYITCILLAIAVGKGQAQLPLDMQKEALRRMN